MFEMRRATAADVPWIAAFVQARAMWMRDRSMPGVEGWTDADAAGVAGQAADPGMPVWVLTREGRPVGVTSVYDESPPWAFTEQERAEPAVFLATTFTDPVYAGQRLGCLIAAWALDHAAAVGARWVRRGCGPYPGLVRYYRDVQGWTLLREVERRGVMAYLFQRRAAQRPGLAALFAGTAPPGV